ncbi:cytochrome c bioproteinsis protein CCS1 [Hibiscus syriacus]|uniref:Cytochrome c bioproteinsis protein CCS1 n=2 Tax=Hibiscus syriacus TaxID=106335 RepID=A0A6A3BVZ2_HIBSY|nr:cytochrome c bioproteinsis protein CCS1 [Hibiscus syriacus]
MPGVKWRGVYLKQLEFMEATSHKRYNSDLLQKKVKKNKLNTIFEAFNRHKEMGEIKGHAEAKTETSNFEVRNSLKQEILQLEERLQDQFVVRSTLEKELSRPFTYDVAVENLIPKDAKELIKDIAVLELEVAHLEKYLLSLYRNFFDNTFLSLNTIDENLKATSMAHKEMFQEVQMHDIMSEKENIVSSRSSIGNPPKECDNVWGTAKLLDSSIYQSHSSLSQRSAYSVDSPQRTVAKAVEQYHSLPLSMLEQTRMDTSSGFNLAEHFGTGINDHVTETPNWLSEEMIKSISAIYCELSDPPLINHDYLSSPLSHSSYVGVVSSRGQGDTNTWSPKCGKFSSFNSHFDNPFSIGEPKEYSGPYCTMVKVQWICRDSKKLQDIEHKLQYYRSLVYQLEEVDVRRMKHEEKLAFWINVHNSLVMHAFLVYGIPKNNLKRLSLLLKTISIDTIQSSILGCRLPRPGQWLRILFPSKTKFKVGDPRRAYAIKSPEPFLHFALCSGSYSDPAVRIYTPKKVFQELEVAKEEYIKANWSINKEQKIMLPKLMEYFAKDSNVCSAGLLQMVEQFTPASLRKNLQPSCKRKTGKTIEWISHNFAFRYLFSKELAQ